MKFQKAFLILSTMLFTVLSFAEKADPMMKVFNVKCPAKVKCPEAQKAFETCKNSKKKDAKSCDSFVELYKELAPVYDCQRPFDHSATEDYIVPGIWLCTDDRSFYYYAELVSKLKTPKGKEFFASEAYRSTLDGESGEAFLEKSKAAQRALKK